MKKTMVSILCLAYNEEDFIKEALDSFLMQRTNFPFEIVVQDDASTDGTTNIIREYESKYPKIVHPIYQTENQYKKMQHPSMFVFAAARGKYNADCDGDDYWTDPLKLQKQVDFLEVNPDYVMCYHDWNILSNRVFHRGCQKKDFTQDELITDPTGVLPSTRMYRNLFSNKTRKDFDDFRGDYPFNVLMGTFGKCKYIDGILPSIYRIHGRNIWSSMSSQKQAEAIKNMHKRLYDLMVERGNPHYIQLRRGCL